MHLVFVPKNCTSVLQPLDCSVNGPLKAYLRRIHHQYVIEQSLVLEKQQKGLKTTLTKIPLPNRRLCYQHVMKALAAVTQETIIHGWEKARIITQSEYRKQPDVYIVCQKEKQMMAFAENTHEEGRWDKLQDEFPQSIEIDSLLFPRDTNGVQLFNDDVE
ncbi:Conserved_hypothetical protein [Hexamita inflata]|uniref:DDE-1 domain-containing protein n=1 Tax=Hexamita inflata TaxID=28002 RepID=A0AA86P9X2_9EUKA|nr:Conserved hypothetical protein [Hexamita inflata]